MATDTYIWMLVSVATISAWYVFTAVVAYNVFFKDSGWSARKKALVSVFWVFCAVYFIFRGGK